MYRLKSNIEKLEILLDNPVDTNQLDVSVFYTDLESAQKNAYSQFSTTDDDNYVTILNPPAQSVIREADSINIVNIDLDVVYVSIYYNINGTRKLLYRVLLDVGDNLEYTNDHGWKTTDSDGSFKGIGATGATGATGAGVPTGGNAEEVLTKVDGTDYNTYWRDIDSFIIAMSAAL